MEERQVEQLKLNVTNIKNSLFSSNKEIKKLKTDKKNLFSKLEKKKNFREEEQRLEGGKLGVASGFSRIMSSVTSPVRSIFDRILDFIGLIAAGILINNLPAIIQKVQEFFDSDFIKGIGNLLGIIGNGILKLAEFAGLFPKSEQDNIEKNIKETEKRFDDDIKNADAAEKDLISLDRFLGTNSYQESTGSDSAEPKTPEPKTPTPKESFSSGSDSNTKEITASKPAQSFSRGGTVRSEGSSPQTPSLESKQTYRPQMSGVPKKVQRDTNNGFRNFPIAVDNIYETTRQHEKNVLAFSKMLKKSREFGFIGGTPHTPHTPDPNSKNNGGQRGNTPSGYDPGKTGSFSSGAWIGNPGDRDGEQTGLNMNLPGGIGTPIYAPFDMIYRLYGTDGNPSVGLQGTASALGPSGSGFGYYGAYRYMKDGKEYEVLMGHFRDLPYKGSKDGDIIKKGTLLGYQGASGRSVSRTNGIYPHISLHVNGIGFQASNSELVNFAESIKDAKSNKPKGGGPPTLTPYQRKHFQGGKGGSNYRLNRSMNNQSVFIYAVQPVENYVPFPYPMPIETPVPVPTSSPQLSSIWRT